jgi:predicted ATPase
MEKATVVVRGTFVTLTHVVGIRVGRTVTVVSRVKATGQPFGAWSELHAEDVAELIAGLEEDHGAQLVSVTGAGGTGHITFCFRCVDAG